MKLFLKTRKNNKGMSLVELVCAVAIFGVATTAIGSAMVVSAQSYSRGTVEVDVQQEAQTTTNLINNLLVDAVSIDFNDDTDDVVLTIDGEGITYVIQLDADEKILYYSENGGTPGILAKDVNSFNVIGADTFSATRNAQVVLDVEIAGRNYTTTSNTTTRNGSSEQVGQKASAYIDMETYVVLEPGQKYEFDIDVIGMTADEVGGLKFSNFSGANVGDTKFLSKSNTAVKVEIADNAYGRIYFDVYTGATTTDAEGNVEELDKCTVTIDVRRVESITASHTVSSDAGAEYEAGAVYRVNAVATGNELAKKLGKGFDTDYINPKYMDIKFRMLDASGNALDPLDYMGEIYTKEDVDSPYIQFKLLQDMPGNSKIIVTFISKHAAGTSDDGGYYNKASVASSSVDHYANISVDYTIVNEVSGPWNTGGGINRGDDGVWLESGSVDKSKYNTAEYDNANCYKTYMRFWEVDEGEPAVEKWILLNTTGDLQLKLLGTHTSLFKPDKEYCVEFKLEIQKKDGTIAFPEPGAPRSDYISKESVYKTTIEYKPKAADETAFATQLGSYANPIKIYKTGTDYFDAKFVGLDPNDQTQNNVKYVVRQYSSASSYTTLSSFNSGTDTNGGLKIETQNCPTGVYQFCATLDFPLLTYNYDSASFNSATTYHCELYDASGNGTIWVKIITAPTADKIIERLQQRGFAASEELKNKIKAQSNVETLKQWAEWADDSATLAIFESKIN